MRRAFENFDDWNRQASNGLSVTQKGRHLAILISSHGAYQKPIFSEDF